jgi:hypothetical protein
MADKIPVDQSVLQGDSLLYYIFIMVIDRFLKRSQIEAPWVYHSRGRRSSRVATELSHLLSWPSPTTSVAHTLAYAVRMQLQHPAASSALSTTSSFYMPMKLGIPPCQSQ